MNTEVKDVDSRYRAPALDKGLDILELLSAEPHGLTRAEIVRATKKSASEIYRMIERLVARGYISRSMQGDRYELTMKMFLLGTTHPPLRRLQTQAQPHMDSFAERTLQSVHLAALDRTSAVVIAQASAPANWEFRLRVGSQLALLTTGSGETLLAFQDTENFKHLIELARVGGHVIEANAMTAKLDHLTKIKNDGYRVSESQQLVGVSDISVPVLGNDGNAFAVLTCPFIRRIDEAHLENKHTTPEKTLALLRELADNISIK